MTVQTSPYIPSFIIAALSGSRPITLSFSQISDTNIQSTSSFMYDAASSPLKSSQQLHVDWSEFQNHTFFMSAEAKVNIAFDQIINGFPFDGTRLEVETFFEKLSGFDKWVFDQFPKFHGELLFQGSAIGDTSAFTGSYIVVKDAAGGLFPSISKNATGASVLNPIDTSLSIEMQLMVPSGSTTQGVQVVCQKMSGSTQGFSFWLSGSLATENAVTGTFSVVSGAVGMSVSTLLQKGRFNHLCVTLNRDNGAHYLEFFNDSRSVALSQMKVDINDMDINAAAFLIGSGTALTLPTGVVTPVQMLSGVIDELRVFHSARTVQQQQLYAQKSLFSTDDLVLYYRFNEPPTQLGASASDPLNAIVIDSSGNSLHSLIINFSSSLRLTASTDPASSMRYEKDETCPILFPTDPSIVAFNTELLTSASTYDQANPNLITRLIPQHYLLEGAFQEGFVEPEGLGGQAYTGTSIPGTGQLGNVQLMLSLLYVWARFFDEMKLFVDAFSTLRHVDYDTTNTVPNNFLVDLINQYGFHLPPLFNDSNLEQFVRAENIALQISNSNISLRDVQSELMRRVLINLPNVIKSKGTQHSIKAFLRAIGIDPDNSVRLREYGGPTERQLSFSRETKRSVGTMVKFVTSSYAVSPFLSASRVEPGYPFASTVSRAGNGLLTSGSWTWEGIVKYLPPVSTTLTNLTQSLVRLCVASGTITGSFVPSQLDPSTNVGLVANLLAISSSVDPRLVLYFHPSDRVNDPTLQLTLSASVPHGIFDGERWNVSFGVLRNDEFGSRVSSSYFLRLATQNNGEITSFVSASAFFEEAPTGTNVFRTPNLSSSASFIAIGSNNNQAVPSTGGYLNNNTINAEARVTDFTGKMSNFRFWSKALTEDEWKEHVRNYRSTGVETPLINWNYEHTASGSWGRLRMDSMARQESRRANASASLGTLGAITFIDFSENNMHLTGSKFPYDTDNVLAEIFDYSYISPYFDEASTNEKIRARGFQNQALIDATPWAGTAPVYDIVRSEQPTDDVRFVVEFSLIDALNRDIATMFSTLDSLDNALGSPELMYSPDYPDLTRLRTNYFNRIKTKLNFKAFFEFFRWFDTSIGSFIEQLLPRKTNFRGTNFVIESHMLERHKVEYHSDEVYLGETDRVRLDDALYLQLIEGSAKKY